MSSFEEHGAFNCYFDIQFSVAFYIKLGAAAFHLEIAFSNTKM